MEEEPWGGGDTMHHTPKILVAAGLLLATSIGGHAGAWSLDVPVTDAPLALHGGGGDDHVGVVVAGAGDVNGDGYDDFIAGNPMGWSDALPGEAYLVLGGPGGWSGNEPISTADVTFVGEVNGDYAGYSVAGGADVNGDGLDDLMIGAPHYDGPPTDSENGAAYLVLGRATGWTAVHDLSTADASFVGDDLGEWAGFPVALAPDLDGDGLDDLLISGPASHASAFDAGQVYVVFGRTAGWPDHASLSTADASYVGEEGMDSHAEPTNSGDLAGGGLAAPGDINGDGYGDLAVSACQSDPNGISSGQVYLVFGRATGWAMQTSLGLADASFIGESEYDSLGGCHTGIKMASAGDVNGDGLQDLVLSAENNDESGDDAGQVYLVLGRTTGWSFGAPIQTADASFLGEIPGDEAATLAGAGDLDGDGLDDLLLGVSHSDAAGENAGQVYLAWGRPSGWTLDTPMASLDASYIGTSPGDLVGASVAGVGDLDGDGSDDFVIGATGDDFGGESAGRLYVFVTPAEEALQEAAGLTCAVATDESRAAGPVTALWLVLMAIAAVRRRGGGPMRRSS
jgi:hypothetical protein